MGAALSAGIEIVSQVISGEKISWGSVLGTAAIGAVSVAFPGSTAIFAGASAINSGWSEYKSSGSIGRAALKGAISGGLSAIASKSGQQLLSASKFVNPTKAISKTSKFFTKTKFGRKVSKFWSKISFRSARSKYSSAYKRRYVAISATVNAFYSVPFHGVTQRMR